MKDGERRRHWTTVFQAPHQSTASGPVEEAITKPSPSSLNPIVSSVPPCLVIALQKSAPFLHTTEEKTAMRRRGHRPVAAVLPPRPPICIVGLIYETQRPITHRAEGGFQEAAQPNFSPLRAMSGFAFGVTIPPVVLSRYAAALVTVAHFLDRPAAQSPSSLSESPLHQARLVTVGVNRARIAGPCRLGAATANPKVAPYRSLGKSQRCVWGVDPWHTGYDKPTSLTTAAAGGCNLTLEEAGARGKAQARRSRASGEEEGHSVKSTEERPFILIP
ncbi:hypothetical protein CSOJ01_03584 [Colletotrichum sojae]|uniref:Uncharacterized protein n=1 Tax=Colletotrichum sojae TaxID=2175907 RepID=A0A8H6JMI0_9PEZI|nr:hypothetical protein CSOJ01_03584 [Colletotrichum sojae]